MISNKLFIVMVASVTATVITLIANRAIDPATAMAQEPAAVLQGSVAMSSVRPQETPQDAPLLATTVDLKQEYQVIDIVRHYEQFGTGADDLEGALAAGWKIFQEKVRSARATAVVGVRLEIANPTRNPTQKGHLLIYGTAVRLK